MPPFTPFTNYQSDLGRTIIHPTRNFYNSPLGAQFYNTGQVWMGLTIILFIGGLYVFYKEKNWKHYVLLIGQAFGMLAGTGLIMNGIFSEDFGEAHTIWSYIIFISIIIAELFINIALFSNPKFKKPIAYFGFITMLLTAILLLVELPSEINFFMEFIAIYVAETWITLVAILIFYNEIWQNR
ncbi:MAG: DUF998 domain-containing protein [Promethearchaeota archaeon]